MNKDTAINITAQLFKHTTNYVTPVRDIFIAFNRDLEKESLNKQWLSSKLTPLVKYNLVRPVYKMVNSRKTLDAVELTLEARVLLKNLFDNDQMALPSISPSNSHSNSVSPSASHSPSASASPSAQIEDNYPGSSMHKMINEVHETVEKASEGADYQVVVTLKEVVEILARYKKQHPEHKLRSELEIEGVNLQIIV